VNGSPKNIKLTRIEDLHFADKLYQLNSNEVMKHLEYEDLKDKVLIVFGGNSGIGKSIVDIARENKAKVYSFSRSTTNTDIGNFSDVLQAFKDVLAKEHKIPDLVASAISEHHGTTLVEYFYREAKRLNPDKEINPDDFRYKGPKPQSKETVILMLADAIEAATRSMHDSGNATPEKIKTMIHHIISTRLTEGEFSESNLSVREVFLLEDIFLDSLEGAYHTRIKYPGQEEKLAKAK
jgi:hypothetical protein